MALREALTVTAVGAALGGGLAEMPTEAEAYTPQHAAVVAHAQAPRLNFQQFLESQAGAQPVAVAAGAGQPAQTETVTMVSRGLSANAFDVASKTVIIGQDDNIKIDKKTANQCVETKPGETWTNSVKEPNGSLYYYAETTPAKLCRDKYSPTGWVKRGGGETGLDCRNVASLHVTPKAHKNVEVINVHKLNTAFTLIAKVSLSKSVECPGVEGNGDVYGEIKQTFNLKSYLKMNGGGQAKTYFKLVDKATEKAHLDLNCTSNETTTTTTTPGTTPNTPPSPVCTGTPEECTPKDGTQGPGTTTPGQPGGPGAGGQPGNTGGNGETCIDPADTTDGDMNATTSGDLMYGTYDQFGYCVGQAQPLS